MVIRRLIGTSVMYLGNESLRAFYLAARVPLRSTGVFFFWYRTAVRIYHLIHFSMYTLKLYYLFCCNLFYYVACGLIK